MKRIEQPPSSTSCSQNSIPTRRLEMIKEKISFYKLMFVQALAIASGLFIWLSDPDNVSSRSKPHLFLNLLPFDPIIVITCIFIILVLTMMLCMNFIHYYIGELGDPTMRKVGWTMPLAFFVTVCLLALSMYVELLPLPNTDEEVLDILGAALSIYAIHTILFFIPYKKLFDLIPYKKLFDRGTQGHDG